MLSVSKKEGLDIHGVVGDIYEYNIGEEVDVVLLDSIFHFYKRDTERETSFFLRIMDELRSGGLLCVIVSKSKRIESELMTVFEKSEVDWVILFDEYIEYTDKNIEMRMIITRKN
jgi:trans-aconitate methyltransferase